MRAPCKVEQHADAFLAGGGFAEHPTLEHDRGVGGKDRQLASCRRLCPGSLALREGHARRIVRGVLAAARGLVDVGREHEMRHGDLVQQLAPPRRRRGEAEHGGRGGRHVRGWLMRDGTGAP